MDKILRSLIIRIPMLLLLLLLGARSTLVSSTEDNSVLSDFRLHVHEIRLGTLSSWDNSVSACSWDGVSCSGNGRVRVLHLKSITLSTSVLASAIAMLPLLRELQITDANLTGSTMEMSPASCSLEVLHLSHSQLLGSISSAFVDKCKGLKLLNLSHNHLEGELHESIIRSSLEVLDISYNALNGSLSPSLFHVESCKRLRYLDLSNNRIEGKVPASMVTSCPSLREISLAANLFSGVFPSLNTSNRLQRLNLASNNFTEVVLHVDIGCMNMTELDISTNIIKTRVFKLKNTHENWSTTSICPLLKVLNISGNSFSGDFFTSLTSEALNFNSFLPSLETLDASFNGFTGELPTLRDNIRYLDFSSNNLTSLSDSLCLKESSKLESLIMTNNRLSRDIFGPVMHCRSLELLDLSFNELTGEIPENLCDALPHLENLMLWMNRLEGHIPPSLANCADLDVLHLNFNNLNGTIPAELAQMVKLWWLDLSNNRLTGTIPPSFGQLQQLQVLMLSGNLLHGGIPYELANCSRLDTFRVNYNNLSGTIPARIGRQQQGIKSINAYGKEVRGKLKVVEAPEPKCHPGIEHALVVQGISLEEVTSKVNRRLGCFCQRFNVAASYTLNVSSMFSMDVSYNNFTGGIPVEIGDMQSLFVFQVQHNSLSGKIPAELGKLQEILSIDLSYNHLEGSIPATLGSLTKLGVFNVSYNNLSGPIPQAGQMTTFLDSYYGNPYLCGLPTGNSCSFKQVSDGNVRSKLVVEFGDDQLVVGVVFALIAFFTTASVVALC